MSLIPRREYLHQVGFRKWLTTDPPERDWMNTAQGVMTAILAVWTIIAFSILGWHFYIAPLLRWLE